MSNFLGDAIDNIGTFFNLPEFGISEGQGNGATTNTGRIKGTGLAEKSPLINSYYNSKQLQNKVQNSLSFDSKATSGNFNGTAGDNAQIGDPSSYYYGTGGSGSGTGYTAADERAAYDDQINALNSLLGYIDTQKNAGLSSMADKFNYEKGTLDTQYQRALNDYQAKVNENAQAKEKGLNQVDSFANSSYNNLRRILQGGNAGNSSAARELMPYLVSKAATTRRTGVFDTAGQNDRSIASAKDDAEYQYGVNSQDLENQRKSSEQSFLESILGRQNDITGQLKDAQIKRAMANGQGYAQARAAGTAAQQSISDRQAQLASLFGQYKPTYTAKALNVKSPELGQYTVDKAAIQSADKNLPAESSYYQTMLKKKQDLGL